MSNLGLRCCLSVLLVSVWLCFASMRHCALWRILGEEEPCAQGFGDDTDSLGFSEGWLEQKWKGCLIQNFLVFSLPPCNELCAGLFSQVLLPRDKYRAGEWLYCVSHPIVVLYPWWRHYCLGPRMGPGPAPEPGFLIRPSEPIVPSHPQAKVKEGVAFTRGCCNYQSRSNSLFKPQFLHQCSYPE